MDITSLLELRQTVKVMYTRYEKIIGYATRFLLALICVGLINSRIGYREALSGFVVTFLVAMICAVLPTGFTALFCALFILVHLYTFSLESCAVALAIFIAFYLLYYHFSPRDSIILLLTPVMFALHIPAVMPFVVGLLYSPVSVISMGFGTVIWFFLHYIAGSTAGSSSMELDNIAKESMSRIQGIIGALIDDRTMMVYVIAMSLAAIAVYIIRRLSVNRAWVIAIGVGAFVNLLVLLVGDVAMDAKVSLPGSLLGTVLGVAIGFVILFFVFNLDYSKIEKVQFEDDEYYYFVKAVPKYALAERRPSSKNINRSLKAAPDAQAHARESVRDGKKAQPGHQAAPQATVQRDKAGSANTNNRERIPIKNG